MFFCEDRLSSALPFAWIKEQEKKTSIAHMVVLGLVGELRAIMAMIGTRKLISELSRSLVEHGIKMGRDQLFALLR